MLKGYSVIAVIPARGGSKGIPLKNLYPIAGKPLLFYVLQAAKASQYIDTIVVSTDHQDIASYALQEGAQVPFTRPQDLATDTATTISVVYHTLDFFKKETIGYDIVVTLQPTQPLVQGWHIDEALELFVCKQKNVVGVSIHKKHPLLLRTMEEDNSLQPVLKGRSSTFRRQDAEMVYCVNGMLYINSVQEIMENPMLSLNDNECGYCIDTRYNIDIDSLEDIEECLYKMSCQKEESKTHSVNVRG